VFTIGRRDFGEAFRSMVEVESACRDEYFRRLDEALGVGSGRAGAEPPA
jgi:hypothetical protein